MRDAAPPYGTDADDDRYPADDVLADLPRAADGEAMTRILARYAALRHWLLRLDGAPGELTDHAADAARVHLDAIAGPWEEGSILGRLGEAPLQQAGGLLAAAAAEATRAGDRAGAAALRRASRDATLLRLRNGRLGRRPPPS